MVKKKYGQKFEPEPQKVNKELPATRRLTLPAIFSPLIVRRKSPTPPDIEESIRDSQLTIVFRNLFVLQSVCYSLTVIDVNSFLSQLKTLHYISVQKIVENASYFWFW